MPLISESQIQCHSWQSGILCTSPRVMQEIKLTCVVLGGKNLLLRPQYTNIAVVKNNKLGIFFQDPSSFLWYKFLRHLLVCDGLLLVWQGMTFPLQSISWSVLSKPLFVLLWPPAHTQTHTNQLRFLTYLFTLLSSTGHQLQEGVERLFGNCVHHLLRETLVYIFLQRSYYFQTLLFSSLFSSVQMLKLLALLGHQDILPPPVFTVPSTDNGQTVAIVKYVNMKF